MGDLMTRKEQAQMDMLNNKKEISEEGNNSNTKNKILGNIKKKKEDYGMPPPTPNENGIVENEVKTDVISETGNPPTNYKEMLKRFFREKIAGKGLTPEQREKREMRLAKIQDGISAIANLISTTQGAANSYTGQNTRTENTRKKWEEFYKKREEEKRQIYEDQMRALKLEEAIRKRNKDIEEDEKPTSRSPIQRESEFLKQEQQTSSSPIQRESEVTTQKSENNNQAFDIESAKNYISNSLQDEIKQKQDKQELIKMFEEYIIEQEKKMKNRRVQENSTNFKIANKIARRLTKRRK